MQFRTYCNKTRGEIKIENIWKAPTSKNILIKKKKKKKKNHFLFYHATNNSSAEEKNLSFFLVIQRISITTRGRVKIGPSPESAIVPRNNTIEPRFKNSLLDCASRFNTPSPLSFRKQSLAY